MKIRCCVGKSGTKVNKKEGDGATPRGKFSLGKLYYRKDRIKKLTTSLKKRIIKKNMGWCHNVNHSGYNRETNYFSRIYTEKLLRRDYYSNYANVDENEINNTILTILALVSKFPNKDFNDELILLSKNDQNIKIREFSMKILSEHY